MRLGLTWRFTENHLLVEAKQCIHLLQQHQQHAPVVEMKMLCATQNVPGWIDLTLYLILQGECLMLIFYCLHNSQHCCDYFSRHIVHLHAFTFSIVAECAYVANVLFIVVYTEATALCCLPLVTLVSFWFASLSAFNLDKPEQAIDHDNGLHAWNNGIYVCIIYPAFVTPWFPRSVYALKCFILFQ